MLRRASRTFYIESNNCIIKNRYFFWDYSPDVFTCWTCYVYVIYFNTSLERICDFQFMYIIWFLVVYLTYFMKPVKETTFSSKIHKAFFANIRNDCVFSVIKNKQHSYAIRVWALSSWFPYHLQITGKRNLYKFHRNRKRVSNMQV